MTPKLIIGAHCIALKVLLILGLNLIFCSAHKDDKFLYKHQTKKGQNWVNVSEVEAWNSAIDCNKLVQFPRVQPLTGKGLNTIIIGTKEEVSKAFAPANRIYSGVTDSQNKPVYWTNRLFPTIMVDTVNGKTRAFRTEPLYIAASVNKNTDRPDHLVTAHKTILKYEVNTATNYQGLRNHKYPYGRDGTPLAKNPVTSTETVTSTKAGISCVPSGNTGVIRSKHTKSGRPAPYITTIHPMTRPGSSVTRNKHRNKKKHRTTWRRHN